MNESSDPNAIKSKQQRDWNAVAAGWEKWRETLEAGTAAVTDRLLEMAGVRPGFRVLDLACGVGEPALTAARRVGPGGEVVALDQAPAMLGIAARRAQALGLGNVRFVCGDGEAAEGLDGEFDAILCRWGLMFFPDLPAALRRVVHLLRPGRRFAAAVWSRPERVPSISTAISVVNGLIGAPPPPPNAPGPFSLADSESLRRAFVAAGLREVHAEYMPVAFEAPSAQAYMELTRDLSAPVVALVEEQPAERRAEIWQAVQDAARRYALPDGRVRMWNETICISGAR